MTALSFTWQFQLIMCACVLSHIRLFVALWTVAHQAPLFMGFLRQEYWSGLPCPPPGDLPDPGSKLASNASCIDRQIFHTSTTWETQLIMRSSHFGRHVYLLFYNSTVISWSNVFYRLLDQTQLIPWSQSCFWQICPIHWSLSNLKYDLIILLFCLKYFNKFLFHLGKCQISRLLDIFIPWPHVLTQYHFLLLSFLF